MPYRRNSDLPERVRNSLPAHGQDIYREAFNSAWDGYGSPEARRDAAASREETAHKVAWAAVKKVYRKKGDEWVPKNETG